MGIYNRNALDCPVYGRAYDRAGLNAMISSLLAGRWAVIWKGSNPGVNGIRFMFYDFDSFFL